MSVHGAPGGHNGAMAQHEFSLSRYDGPATVRGVEFARVRLSEHADTEQGAIRKGWEGTAEVTASAAPEVGPGWAATEETVQVRLPEGGTGNAHIRGMTLTDGRYWEVELLGTGPSPMD